MELDAGRRVAKETETVDELAAFLGRFMLSRVGP
jgi:hypothetical protein